MYVFYYYYYYYYYYNYNNTTRHNITLKHTGLNKCVIAYCNKIVPIFILFCYHHIQFQSYIDIHRVAGLAFNGQTT